MNPINVKVYAGINIHGGGCGACCSGCGATTENVQMEYNRMVASLGASYKETGQEVKFSFVDTAEKGLADFPEIEKIILNGYSFPITVINDTPYLAGAIDSQAVAEIIDEINRSADAV